MSRRLIDYLLLTIAVALLAVNIFWHPHSAPPPTHLSIATTTTSVAATVLHPPQPTTRSSYSTPLQPAAVVYTVTNNIPASSNSSPPPSYSSPTPITPPTTGTSTPSSSGTWSNAPSDWPVLTDYAFTTPIPTTAGDKLPDNSGWSESYGDRGLLTIVPDTTAPLSPSGVLQFKYPVGWMAGSAPGLLYYDFPPIRKLYAGFYWKPSSPWQGNDDNVNKLVFFDLQDSTNNSDSDFTMIMYGQPGGPYELRIASEIPPVSQWLDDRGPFFGTPVTGTWNHTNITLGVWHKVEILADMDAGKVEYWLDGVQIGSVNYTFPSTAKLIEFQFSPTFGGGGNPKTEDDYYWFDSIHLAGA